MWLMKSQLLLSLYQKTFYVKETCRHMQMLFLESNENFDIELPPNEIKWYALKEHKGYP